MKDTTGLPESVRDDNARGQVENNKLFVYGLLKRGHILDLMHYDAKFEGEAYIPDAILYRISEGVGLRFIDKYQSATDAIQGVQCAHGEVFEIPDDLWIWLDSIENNRFTYTRKIVDIIVYGHGSDGEHVEEITKAWVYEHTYPNMKYSNPIVSGRY